MATRSYLHALRICERLGICSGDGSLDGDLMNHFRIEDGAEFAFPETYGTSAGRASTFLPVSISGSITS